MSKINKLEFYKKQIELEKLIVETAEKSVADVKNQLVKELIMSIALDSRKHASLLSALIVMTTEVSPYIEEEKLDVLSENIKKHIELEAKAIQTYKELLDTIDNEQEKLIVQAIYHDEIRHHNLLKKIHEIVVKREAITEDDMFEFLKDDYIPQF